MIRDNSWRKTNVIEIAWTNLLKIMQLYESLHLRQRLQYTHVRIFAHVLAQTNNSLLTTVRGGSPRDILSIFIEIILVMVSIASEVQPAMCGVSIKFSRARILSSRSGGSLQNTSNAAPAIL
jgi:hypothetical protein